MPTVLSLDIGDNGLADVARKLLFAHLFIIPLGLIIGILEIIQYFSLRAVLADLSSEDAQAQNTPRNIINATAQVILNTFLPFLCPTFLFFLVRTGLRHNSKQLMQSICFFDACCSCCTACAVLSGIASCVTFTGYKDWADEVDCKDSRNWDVSEADCLRKRSAISTIFGVGRNIAIVGTIVSICEMCTCLLGTVKANEATNALMQNRVFCAPPNFTTGALEYGQNNVVMVVGQPVSPNAVPMGQPVQVVVANKLERE